MTTQPTCADCQWMEWLDLGRTVEDGRTVPLWGKCPRGIGDRAHNDEDHDGWPVAERNRRSPQCKDGPAPPGTAGQKGLFG